MRNSTLTLLAVLLVAVTAIGAVAYVSGSKSAPLSVAGVSGEGEAAAALADCNPVLLGANMQPIYTVVASYIDPTQNNQELIASALYNIYKPGIAAGLQPGTTSNSTSAGLLSPCSQYNIIVGDGGNTTYYYSGVTKVTTRSAETVPFKLVRAAAPTVRFVNNSGAWASTVTLANGTTASATYSDISMRITAPTTQTYGDLGYAICTRFQSTNVSKVYPNGYLSEVSIKHWKASSTKDTVKCYEMANTDVLKNGAVITIPMTITAESARLPAAADAIDIAIYDKTNVLFNGNLEPGYESRDGLGTDTSRASPVVTGAVTFAAG